MITIIKLGKDADPIMEGKCWRCATEIECLKSDAKQELELDLRVETYSVVCPHCEAMELVVTEKNP